MKHFSIQAENWRLSVFVSVMLLNLLVVANSCSDRSSGDAAVKGMQAPAPAVFVPQADSVPAFYLDRNTFLALDDSIIKYKDKLVLQFGAGQPANKFLLSTFTIADEEKKLPDVSNAADREKIKPAQPFANVLKLSGKTVKIINQRTREDDYQKLLKEVKKYRFINYVIFLPEVEGDHVRFKITGVEKLPLDLMATGFATTSFLSRSF